MKEQFFLGIYCPPFPPKENYPNKITKEVYGLLAKAGIGHVYGYYEDEAGEEYLQAALDCCAANNILFYPRMKIFDRYLGCREGESEERYNALPQETRDALDQELIRQLNKVKDHPGFGGILFSDERPYEAYDGMGAASRIFATCCPDKEFHYNQLNYFADDRTMFYRDGSDEGREVQLKGELAFSAENRFQRYKRYTDGYLDKCETQMLSTDLYPFAPTWEHVPTSIHRGLYETNSFFATYRQQRHIHAYCCVQVGNWEKSFRTVGRAETALHMNMIAAYQLDGIIFFPGVFPNDWIAPEGETEYTGGEVALIDAYGKPTTHIGYISQLNEHLQQCAPTLLSSKWLGVTTVGEFAGGFGDVDVDAQEWSECIYRGELPGNETHAYQGQLPIVRADSQVYIGVFENDTSDIYWVVNNSIVTDTSFCFEEIKNWKITRDGKQTEGSGGLRVSELNAGEAVMIEIEKRRTKE